MSRNVSSGKSTSKLPPSNDQSLNCTEWHEFSHSINASISNHPNESTLLCCIREESFGSSACEDVSSSLFIASNDFGAAHSRCDGLSIEQRQILLQSKCEQYLNGLESCECDWEITTDYDPREFVEEGDVAFIPETNWKNRSERKSFDSSQFLADDGSPDHAAAKQRSGTTIESITPTINGDLMVESDSEKAAFTLSEESESEMRNAVDNIVQQLNVTSTDEQPAVVRSATDFLPAMLGKVERKVPESDSQMEIQPNAGKVPEGDNDGPVNPIICLNQDPGRTLQGSTTLLGVQSEPDEKHDELKEPATALGLDRLRTMPGSVTLTEHLLESGEVAVDKPSVEPTNVLVNDPELTGRGSGLLLRDQAESDATANKTFGQVPAEPQTVHGPDELVRTTTGRSESNEADKQTDPAELAVVSNSDQGRCPKSVEFTPDQMESDGAAEEQPLDLTTVRSRCQLDLTVPDRNQMESSQAAEEHPLDLTTVPSRCQLNLTVQGSAGLTNVASCSSIVSVQRSVTLVRNHVVEDEQLSQLTVVPSSESDRTVRESAAVSQNRTESRKVEEENRVVPVEPRTAATLDPDRAVQEPKNDMSIDTPSDPILTEPLTWHDSSTPDMVPTPTLPFPAATGPSKVPEAIVVAPPSIIKLNPITKKARYRRGSKEKKNVQFAVPAAAPERPKKDESGDDRAETDRHVPCYKTRWSSRVKPINHDPYEVSHIRDDGDSTFERLFPDRGTDTDSSAESARRALLKLAQDEFGMGQSPPKTKPNQNQMRPSKEREVAHNLISRNSLERIIMKATDNQMLPRYPETTADNFENSVENEIHKLLKMTEKEFQPKKKKRRKQNWHEASQQSEYCLVRIDMLETVVREYFSSVKEKLVQKPPTADVAVQACVEAKDIAVGTRLRPGPAGKSLKRISKKKTEPVIELDEQPQPATVDKMDRKVGKTRKTKQNSEAEAITTHEHLAEPDVIHEEDNQRDNRRLKQTTLSPFARDNHRVVRRQSRKQETSQPDSTRKPMRERRQPAFQTSDAFRSHISFRSTTPSESREVSPPSTITESERSIICPNATVIVNVAPSECGSFCRRLNSIRFSGPDCDSPNDDDVPSTQHFEPAGRRTRRYSCSVVRITTSEKLQSTNADAPTNDPTINVDENHGEHQPVPTVGPLFNDPDVFPEEFINFIGESLAMNIERRTLPAIEKTYDAPEELSTIDIARMLLTGFQDADSPDELGTLMVHDDDGSGGSSGSDPSGVIDSDMDETIRPATYTVQQQHCSSTKRSQVPRLFSPDYSPIRFSGTPAKDCEEKAFHSDVNSPVCKKPLLTQLRREL